MRIGKTGNYKLYIIGISVIIIVVGLCGCVENESLDQGNSNDADKQKFVGTWVSDDKNAMYLFGDTVTFYSNGMISTGTLGHEGTYEVKKGRLYATYEEYNNEDSGRIYLFSSDGLVLTLTDSFWDKTAVYNKQINENSNENDGNGGIEELEDEIIDYTVPESVKTLIYDSDKLEVFNFRIETWAYIGSEGTKLADGIVKIPYGYEKAQYIVFAKAKNIAGKELSRVDVKISLEDKDDIPIVNWGGTSRYYNKCDGCSFAIGIGQYLWEDNFDKPDHLSMIITVFD